MGVDRGVEVERTADIRNLQANAKTHAPAVWAQLDAKRDPLADCHETSMAIALSCVLPTSVRPFFSAKLLGGRSQAVVSKLDLSKLGLHDSSWQALTAGDCYHCPILEQFICTPSHYSHSSLCSFLLEKVKSDLQTWEAELQREILCYLPVYFLIFCSGASRTC